MIIGRAYSKTSTNLTVKKLILLLLILFFSYVFPVQVFAATYGECSYGEGSYNTGCTSPLPSPTPSVSPSPTPAPPNTGGSSPSYSPPSPAHAPTCTDAVPVGEPDFFQINRTKTSATLYFTPVNDNVENYHVIYGLWQGDERFGSLSTHVTKETNNGVQSFTISDLNPKSEYWFKVAPVNGCAVGTWSSWMKAGKWKNKETFFYKYFHL